MNDKFQQILNDISDFYGVSGGYLYAEKDGKTLVREVFGVEDVNTGVPVDDSTLFIQASVSKTFTSTLVAMLCDDGLLDWDKPIRTWWPDFYLGDDYVSEHVNLADMLGHRTGLSSLNFLRRCPDFGPMDPGYVESIQKVPLSAGFREKFIYCNETYRIAGALMERVTGKTFETLLQERIAEPLGMDICCTGLPVTNGLHIAQPHESVDKKPQRGEFNWILGLNHPCGELMINLRSMEKWGRFWANQCCLPDGTRLLSMEQYRRVQQPVMFWSHPTPPEMARSYALGWAPSVYNGYICVYHGGCLFGYNTAVAYFPQLNASCAVATNTSIEGQRIATLFRHYMYDLICGTERDSYRPMLERWAEMDANATPEKKPEEFPVSVSELEDLVGDFWNDAYHTLILSVEDDRLCVNYGSIHGTIPCIAKDEFKGFVQGFPLHFRFAPDHKTAEFSFTYEPCFLRFEKK